MKTYNRSRKEPYIDPENIKEIKNSWRTGQEKYQDFKEDLSGSDLDIPGSELDDQAEEIGSEDEENNYYSLGGDNHLDLEENKGVWFFHFYSHNKDLTRWKN